MTQTLLLMVGLFTAMTMAVSFYWNNRVMPFITIALFVILANAIYFSLDGAKGWPAEEPVEVKGVLASVIIVNPSDGDPGAIYISLYPTTPKKWYEYVYPRIAPKTFYVKYSNDRAAAFEEAKQAMEEGREVRINGIPPENATGGQNGDGESPQETIQGIIGQYLSRILPEQGDTYRPTIPDIEIRAPEVPPEKGSN